MLLDAGFHFWNLDIRPSAKHAVPRSVAATGHRAPQALREVIPSVREAEASPYPPHRFLHAASRLLVGLLRHGKETQNGESVRTAHISELRAYDIVGRSAPAVRVFILRPRCVRF